MQAARRLSNSTSNNANAQGTSAGDRVSYRGQVVWRWLLAGCCFVWSVAPAFCGEPVVVRLKTEVDVTRPVIALGDVADVLCSSDEVRSKLETVTLAPTPAPGRVLRIDFATIHSRLQSHGINLAEVNFSGRSAVEVRSVQSGVAPKGRIDSDVPIQTVGYEQPSEPSPEEQLKQAENRVRGAIRGHLQKTASDLGVLDVSVQLLREAIPVLLASPAEAYEISGGRPPWNLPQVMMIRIRDTYGDLVEIPILCRIELQPKVLVARYDVPKGHILRSEDLTWKEVSAVGLHFTAMGDLLGREASRPLPAGHLLKQDDIREVPLVRTNEICTVYSGQAGLVIRRQYKARSDGAKGQTIPMISLDSGTQILARVTGLHEAVVVGAGDALNGALGAPLPVGATQPGVIYSEEQQPRTNPAGVGPPRRFQRRPQEQLEEAGALPFPTAREGLR